MAFQIKQKHFFMILELSELTKIISKTKLWNCVSCVKPIKLNSAILIVKHCNSFTKLAFWSVLFMEVNYLTEIIFLNKLISLVLNI